MLFQRAMSRPAPDLEAPTALSSPSNVTNSRTVNTPRVHNYRVSSLKFDHIKVSSCHHQPLWTPLRPPDTPGPPPLHSPPLPKPQTKTHPRRLLQFLRFPPYNGTEASAHKSHRKTFLNSRHVERPSAFFPCRVFKEWRCGNKLSLYTHGDRARWPDKHWLCSPRTPWQTRGPMASDAECCSAVGGPSGQFLRPCFFTEYLASSTRPCFFSGTWRPVPGLASSVPGVQYPTLLLQYLASSTRPCFFSTRHPVPGLASSVPGVQYPALLLQYPASSTRPCFFSTWRPVPGLASSVPGIQYPALLLQYLASSTRPCFFSTWHPVPGLASSVPGIQYPALLLQYPALLLQYLAFSTTPCFVKYLTVHLRVPVL